MICLVTKKVRWSIRFRCKAPITTFSTIGQRIFFFFFFKEGARQTPPLHPPPVLIRQLIKIGELWELFPVDGL